LFHVTVGTMKPVFNKQPSAILGMSQGRAVWPTAVALIAAGGLFLSVLGAALPALFLMALLGLILVTMVYFLGGPRVLGVANHITLVRALLVSWMIGALAVPQLFLDAVWPLLSVALLVLALDGVDGWVARRLDQCTAFGARFDMEVDAALIMVLCLALWMSGQAEAWVLLIGAMRYAFVLAGSIAAWLRRPLPYSFRRKLVCVVQVAALLIALSPLVGSGLQAMLLATALLALTYSFAVDVIWLWRQRQPEAALTHENYRSAQ